ncbi:hypothetical protein M6B38_402245 [Iris pallida]|uniref:Uncharacterized protein n=1 Tax=Iris pallida TaxID=29817 RepID=A0AAX6FT51_IRIPA|nr:hypothetical protein M6B38_402245 [Iris pallida]
MDDHFQVVVLSNRMPLRSPLTRGALSSFFLIFRVSNLGFSSTVVVKGSSHPEASHVTVSCFGAVDVYQRPRFLLMVARLWSMQDLNKRPWLYMINSWL